MNRVETSRLRRNIEHMKRIALLTAGLVLAANAYAAVSIKFYSYKPNAISFKPGEARFVRVFIQACTGAQPCIDELEVYGSDKKKNLALASNGAKAAASSCLTGYPIHQIHHLNDGKYGNAHSWISAGRHKEWAQVELAAPAVVSKVVLSRDRGGNHHDRLPTRFDILTSMDGKKWKTVAAVTAAPVVPAPRAPAGVAPLPREPVWDNLLTYAFNAERNTWNRMSRRDHLSPLRRHHPYWTRIAKMTPVERTLTQMKDLADRLEAKGIDVSAERRELAQLEARKKDDASLYHDARLAKRRLMFRDPALAPLERVLFVKRQPYHASHNYSDVMDSAFRSGGGICVLEFPGAGQKLDPTQAKLTVLFDGSKGIARDPVADFDARKIYFAFRPQTSPQPGWRPYWHLMSMNVDGTGQRKLTDGPFHDMHPLPLPDGGLAFITTRCKARFLCWRPQAFVMFRMDTNGANMLPLSFANISEWTPAMMRDGRILWTRSEYQDKGANFGHTLWAIRPDGTHPELIFGNNTINCYINGKEVPDSREICSTIFSHGGDHNGPIGLIDPAAGRFNSAGVTNITPDITPHYDMGWPRYVCFRDPTPISRDYILVSHAPGRRFGLYVIDRYGNRELLYIDPKIGSMCATPLCPTPRPRVISRTTGGSATLFVSDVYQGLPGVKRGSVKYIRVCQEVRADLLPKGNGEYQDDHRGFTDWYATPIHKVRGPFGWPSYVAKGSLGLAPVHPDGSAHFRVPAGKTIYFQALDKDYNELQRMRSVMQLQPGEKRSCVGCHENRKMAPPNRVTRAGREAPVDLDIPPWGAVPFSYEKVVQPVLDRNCVRCHSPGKKARLNLTGVLDREKIPASYRSLVSGGWVHYFNWSYGVRHHKAKAKTFGTLKSKLWRVLNKGHNKVKLRPDEVRAIKCWIDLNCPLWPDYIYRMKR